MQTYRAKTLIPGYRLGKKFGDKEYIAVPQKSAESGRPVAHGNKLMPIAGKEPVARRKFTDKYGRGFYYLYYYEWLPKKLVIGETI